MKSTCDISFIIPARNEEPALQETLSHLQTTVTAKTLEIVLIDDCSDTPLIDEINAPAPLIYHRCHARQGVAKARNIGATLANGHVLFFIDAHVCFSDNVVEELFQSGVAEGPGIRGCATQLVRDFDRFVQLSRRRFVELDEHTVEYYGWRFVLDPLPDVKVNRARKRLTPFSVPYVGSCALAVSKSLFVELGGFDDGLVGFGSLEDAELAMRCWIFGKDVNVIPAAKCFHYSGPMQLQANKDISGRSPLDDPRYDGSFLNALRVMYLHFPDSVFADVVMKLNHICLERGLSGIDSEFPSTEMRARRAWLDSRRIRSRDWLFDRLINV